MARRRLNLNTQNTTSKITSQVLREAQQRSYLTFNFTFLSSNDEYNFKNPELSDEVRHLIFMRLCEISTIDIVELTASTGKRRGLEKISTFSRKDKLSKLSLPTEFSNSARYNLAGQGFWIFRLCPNNNPYPTRIIGKMINDIFFIMFIDLKHQLYAKRN